jgi:hypothetical protein
VIPTQNVHHPYRFIYTHFNITDNYIEHLPQFILYGSGTESVAHVPYMARYKLKNGTLSRGARGSIVG